ncbi:Replication termination factor 2 [Rhizina undulata]
MGNDGGSIPTRRELVKTAARHPTHSQVRDSAAQSQAYHWTTCPLSKRPLSSPVVSDYLGRLYNKDAIIEWLLRGIEAYGDGEEVLDGRIKSLKDVVEVKFEVLNEDESANGSKVSSANDSSKWVCPVSRKELGPGVKSVYLIPCGHAFSESAVKEISGDETNCFQCNASYEISNVITINSVDPEELKKLQDRIKDLAEKCLTHALKKSSDKVKKRKKDIKKTDLATAESSSYLEKKKKDESSGLKNAATANLTRKVLEDEKLRNKRRRIEMNDNVKGLFTTGKAEPGKNKDFMSRGYTIPAGRQI